jgi:hypothetical protein
MKAGALARWIPFVGPAALLLALTQFGWLHTFQYGPIEGALGSYAALYWLSLIGWLTLSVLAVRYRQRWWVIASLPVVLYPLVMVGGLLFECAGGNCL